MSTIAHHPSDAMLMSYAAGALGEGLSLVVAAHLSMCDACRDRMDGLEAVGGALLEDIPPIELKGGALDDIFARIDAEPEIEPAPQLWKDPMLPSALADYVPEGSGALQWAGVAPGLKQVKLFKDMSGFTARLLRISAGKPMPRHGHGGMEMTLVLDGGYQDEGGAYRRGDLAEHDDRVEHRPVADADGDCICLVVTDAPVQLRGLVGRLFQPLVGI